MKFVIVGQFSQIELVPSLAVLTWVKWWCWFDVGESTSLPPADIDVNDNRRRLRTMSLWRPGRTFRRHEACQSSMQWSSCKKEWSNDLNWMKLKCTEQRPNPRNERGLGWQMASCIIVTLKNVNFYFNWLIFDCRCLDGLIWQASY